jgi:hypothetical protein
MCVCVCGRLAVCVCVCVCMCVHVCVGPRGVLFLMSVVPLYTEHLKISNVATKFRCTANVAHRRQSRPDYGHGCQVKVLKTV